MKLRTQLMLAVSVVVIIVLVLLAWASSSITRHELRLFLDEAPGMPNATVMESLAQDLSQWFDETDPAGVRSSQSLSLRLREYDEQPPGWLLLVVDTQHRVLAHSHTQLGHLILQQADGHWRLSDDRGQFVLLFDDLTFTAVTDDNGDPVAYLTGVAMPPLPNEMAALSRGHIGRELLHSIDSGILWALAACGVLAVLLTGLMVHRGLLPLQRMTQVLERMRDGDDQAHMPVNGPAELSILGQRFNELLEQHRATAAQRRDELNNLAHELRTPLTGVRCQLEAMIDGIKPTSPAELHELHREVLHLQAVLQDLQSLALLEAGDIGWQLEMVDLRALLDERLRRIGERVAGIEWNLVSPQSRVMLESDPRRLRQIIDNLLSNAARHAPAGSSVEVRLVLDMEQNTCRVQFRDQGPGVMFQDAESIFLRFYRVNGSAQGSGAGLGLPIARSLARLIGGDIRLLNPGERGACFEWFVPL
ncbi:MAG: hypothetical protein Tsb002_32550 [Wenzhouxiangellaceae bacterium]